MKEERKIEILLDHMGSEVTHDYNDLLNCDYCLCEESTADGFTIYTFLEPNETPCINENVYYYNHDLGNKIVEVLMEGNKVVFVDEYEYHDLDIHELLLGEFEEYIDDILEDEKLPANEVKELMKEYVIEDKL